MANKKFSDLTAATSVAKGDLIAIETVGGNSRKVLAELAGTAFGTSFPGSPASGDRFFRSDRAIQYYYDGTRWLSLQLLTMPFPPIVAQPITATTSGNAVNPWWGDYDIYVEKLKFAAFITTTTAANYFTLQLVKLDPGSSNVGSTLSTQSISQNTWTTQSLTINAVVASTVELLEVGLTETGTASGFMQSAITYRLVG